MTLHRPQRAFRTLTGHNSAGKFGDGPGGHDSLAARALITAGEPVDLKRRTRPALFQRRVPFLPSQCGHTEEMAVSLGVERQTSPHLTLPSGDWFHSCIEACHADVTIGIH